MLDGKNKAATLIYNHENLKINQLKIPVAKANRDFYKNCLFF
jgi:hypothetical protein